MAAVATATDVGALAEQAPQEKYDDLLAETEQFVLAEQAKETENLNKKWIAIKLLLYFIEIVILILITSRIANVWAAVAVGVIGGFIMTKAIDIIMKRMGMERGAGQIEQDSKRSLITAVVSGFPFIPGILKDKIATIAYGGQTVKETADTQKRKAFKALMDKYLAARQALREKNPGKSLDLLDELIQKAEGKEDAAALLAEARMFRDELKRRK